MGDSPRVSSPEKSLRQLESVGDTQVTVIDCSRLEAEAWECYRATASEYAMARVLPFDVLLAPEVREYGAGGPLAQW